MHWRGRTLLVTRVNARQYGHLGLEILMSLARARELHADVCFVRPRHVVAAALFEIDTRDVRVRRSAVSALAARGMWWADDQRVSVQMRGSALADAWRRERAYQLDRHIEAAEDKSLRDALKMRARRLKVPVAPQGVEPDELPLYYQRRLIRHRVAVFLPEQAMSDVKRAAAAHGLDLDAPLVTVHVREAGWKFGREMQDAKPNSRNDSVRNARIETYFDALDYLVEQGFTVVRMGDPSMTPVRRRGVVDLATAGTRSQLLEIACLMRSVFFLSGEAGPVGVSYLTNTPLLTVNATDPISSYPIRDDGMYILKQVVDRRTGRRLSIEEQLSAAYLAELRNVERYSYIDNTAEEIRCAVTEMLAWIRGSRDESEAQRRFRDLATDAGESLRASLSYVRKWGSDQGFLGDGRICRFFAEARA